MRYINAEIRSLDKVRQYWKIFQHLFRRNMSTIKQLVTVTHDFAAAIENHQQIDAIYLDLSTAFDRVPHNIIVVRLIEIGLADIFFVRKRLTLKTTPNLLSLMVLVQVVNVSYQECHRAQCWTIAVPSVLNNIAKDTSESMKVKLFADTALFSLL